MTNRNDVQSNTVEFVTGAHAGAKVGVAVDTIEILAGEKVGLEAPAVTPSIIVDMVVGCQVGSLGVAQAVTLDVVAGKQVGQDVLPEFYYATVEYVVKDASYKVQMSTIEYVVQVPDAPTSIMQQARTLQQTVVQHRATPAVPQKSMEIIGQVRQLIAQRNVRPHPIACGPVYTARQVVAQDRIVPPAPLTQSLTTAYTARQIVAQSRTRGPVPVAAQYAFMLRQNAALRRATTAPSDIRTAITAYTDVQLVAISRRTRLILTSADAFTLQEIVAQRRDAPAPHSVTTAYSFRQLAAQHRATDIWWSNTKVHQNFQLAVQQRTPTPPFSATVVPALRQTTALARDTEAPTSVRSPIEAGQYVQSVAQHRAVPGYQWSDATAYTLVNLVAQRRVPYVRPSDLMVLAQQQLVAMHREVPVVGAQSQTRVETLRQVAAQRRDMTHVSIGDIEAYTLQVQYMLARVVPAPGDNFDPFTGVHNFALQELVAQRRDVDPPYIISQASRFVLSVTAPTVLGAAYPDPTISITDLTVHQVARPTVLGDVMPDPYEAHSQAQAFMVSAQTALGDVMPDPLQPLSAGVALSVQQAVLVGDAMPDPLQPLSSIAVGQVAQFPVLGDEFATPSAAASVATVNQVVEQLALGDVMPDPNALTSQVDLQSVTQFAVLQDSVMMRLPARTNRRRPQVIVSMS